MLDLVLKTSNSAQSRRFVLLKSNEHYAKKDADDGQDNVFRFIPLKEVDRSATLAKKSGYSRNIHEIDPLCNHVKSCDIDFDLRHEFATRRLASRVDVEPKLDIVQDHMIKLQINLMNFSTVNNFFGQGSS